MAVLSFRRALRKESGHAEALHNLRLVESRLEDKFNVSSSVWEGMKEALAESGMLRAAGKWAFWLLLLAVLIAGVRFFSLPEKIRKVSSVVSLLLVLFALMAEGLTFLSPSSSEAENEWVVITETESHAAPSATSPVQRKLHPGTVVNGPGEMADADYGYVGAARHSISLYKGKECIERNVPETEAIPHLVALIKANGDWVDP